MPVFGYGNKTCTTCGKVYYQAKIPQKEFERDIDDDICPYCGACNGSSMNWNFDNRKYDDVNIDNGDGVSCNDR